MSSEIQVDEETRAALLLFNERIEQGRADERAAKRLAKAERAKTDAASRVREVGADSRATPEQKAEAEATYKAAVAEFARISEDPHAEDPKPEPPSVESEPESAEAPTEVSADEETAPEEPTEVSADEETAPEAVDEPAPGDMASAESE